MAIQRKPYFYDAQVKRYILQIMAAFAGYQVRSGVQRDGEHRYINVPIMFGTYDRLVAYLRGDGNINKTPSLPIMSLEIKAFKQYDELRRAPDHVDTFRFTPRAPATMEGTLGTAAAPVQGERGMPVPYLMTVNLNIWSSNLDQALQIIEQIASQYNPQLDIMLSNSPLDWTFISYLKFLGDIEFKRRALDIGGGTGTDQLHLAELDFETLVHISPPAKIFKSQYIEKIHTTFRKLESNTDIESMDVLDGFILQINEDDAETIDLGPGSRQ